jgi:hypothetical protein
MGYVSQRVIEDRIERAKDAFARGDASLDELERSIELLLAHQDLWETARWGN